MVISITRRQRCYVQRVFQKGGEKNGSSNSFWSKEPPEEEFQDQKQNRTGISQVVCLRRGGYGYSAKQSISVGKKRAGRILPWSSQNKPAQAFWSSWYLRPSSVLFRKWQPRFGQILLALRRESAVLRYTELPSNRSRNARNCKAASAQRSVRLYAGESPKNQSRLDCSRDFLHLDKT